MNNNNDYPINSDTNEKLINLNSRKTDLKLDNNLTYRKSFLSGIVWLSMFLFSFVALFLIFQTPYYKYYDQTGPILIENANPLVENNKNVFNSNDDLLFNNELNNTSNKQQDNNNIKKNTSIEKQNKEAPIVHNKTSSISTLFKEPNAESNNITASNEKISTNNPNVSKPSNSIVWLINIYSSNNKNILSNKLAEFKKQYNFLKKDYIFYVITININNDTKYRISIANNNLKYYQNFNDASTVCNTFKLQGLDCFVSSTDKNSLVILNK